MGLADATGFKTSRYVPYFNTCTPIDIAVGQMVRGVNNSWVLDGGAGPVNGLSGRSGYFKSTTTDNLVVNMLDIYPDSEYFKLDTENTSTSIARFESYALGRNIDVQNRVHITNKGEMSTNDYVTWLRKLGEEKLAHAKDYTVETPFLDVSTGKPLKMLLPTFQSLDSISNLTTDNILMALEGGIEDKKNNTADMHDGRIKKRLVDLIITWAYRYNFVFFITAHIGEKHELDPSRPTPKQNQWMSASEKITNAGKNFLFLPNLSFQIARPRPLVDNDKRPLYPSSRDANDDLEKIEINRLDLKVLRGKNNVTGTVIPSVMSQHYGILADLSYYEYLREVDGKINSGQTGDSGFSMQGYNRFSPLLPEVAFARKTLRTVCHDDYRARRTLELMYQFNWISRYWNLRNYPFDIPATLEKLVEGINQSSSIMLDDVVQSRGYWTYSKTEKRKYMSILDIIELVGVKSAPKSVSVPDKISESDIEAALAKEAAKVTKK